MTKKKGLSIGAAMKQRMTTVEEQEAPEPAPAPEAVHPQADVPAALPRNEDEPLDSFNTRLPRSLQRRLKVHVAVEGRKIQAVVQQALDEYLRKFES